MTKALPHDLFYRHIDRIMGREIPSYVSMDSTLLYTRQHSQENGGGLQ